MFTVSRFRLGAGKAIVASVIGATLVAFAPSPGTAQAQPAPAGQTAVQPDTATIDIFARRKSKSITAQRTARIDSSKASSCHFGTNLGDVANDPVALLTYELENDEAFQNYFESMGVENPLYGYQTDPLQPMGGVYDTSPLNGDQSGNMTAAEGNAGGCSAADNLGIAARNFIARKDKSLQQAYDALNAKDYPKALAFFKEGYNKVGYPQAAFMIGKMYLVGLGTPRDVKEAVVWFKRVAEGAYDEHDILTFNPADPYYKNARIDSQVTLANIYMSGLEVTKSPKDARKWYAEAEKYGYVPADYMLGMMTESGYGDIKSPAKAVTYYQKAGEYGFGPAQYRLGQLYYDGADGVAQDKTRAGAWLLLAAKAGYPDALYAVGRMYELGEGGASVDLPKALVYYKEAAIKGQVDAELTLATYLYTGEGGAPKDLDTARKLFEAAAEAGDQDAMFNLAVMMTNGEGGPKDLVHAYCWFYIADKGGVEKAKAAMQELSSKMTADERAQAETILNPPKPTPKS